MTSTGQRPARLAADEGAERAVLGSLILYGEPRHVKTLQGQKLRPEHFYWSGHGDLFAAAISLAERKAGIDPLTLAIELEHLGRDVQPADRIGSLTVEAPDVKNFGAYAERVIELARWRERQRVTYGLTDALSKRDAKAWDALMAEMAPPARHSNGNGNGSKPALRLVVDGETGEVMDEEHHCASCQATEDQLAGAQREIAGWRSRYAKLARDLEAEARNDALWLVAQALHKRWKQVSGHTRSKWTADRFWACQPMLKLHGPEMFERGIAGICNDPYTKVRKNGTVKRYDDWETLCKSEGAFEEYCNRAPLDWKPTLKITVGNDAGKSVQQQRIKEAS